jgi:hypothetical protein
MRIDYGDLWKLHAVGPICIPTNGMINKNGHLVMGAGLALQAKKRFPDVPRKLGKAVDGNGNVACYLRDERLFSMPTKNDWRDKSDLELIKGSCRQLLWLTNYLSIKQVFLPAPGCGLGGLPWSVVKPVIAALLDDRFTVILQRR